MGSALLGLELFCSRTPWNMQLLTLSLTKENYNFVFSEDQSIILYKIYILYKIFYNLEHNTDIVLRAYFCLSLK